MIPNIIISEIPLFTAVSLDSEYIRESTKLFNSVLSSTTFTVPNINTKVVNKKKGRKTRKQRRINLNLVSV